MVTESNTLDYGTRVVERSQNMKLLSSKMKWSF